MTSTGNDRRRGTAGRRAASSSAGSSAAPAARAASISFHENETQPESVSTAVSVGHAGASRSFHRSAKRLVSDLGG